MSQIYVNNFKTTLSANIGSTDLTIPVVDASMLPATTISPTNYYMVTLEYNGVIEIVQIIGVSYNNLIVNPTTTIGRGAEGTTAAIFPVGTRVEGRITAGTLSNIIYLANTANTATNNSLSAVTSSLSSSISSETSRATTAEGGLSTLVANDIATLSASTSASFTTTNGNLSAEISRATAAEASEAGIRAAADSNLNALITSGRVQPGTVITWPFTSTPSGGYIQLLPGVAFVSNTSYPTLYNMVAANGFPWGVGAGTFGIPGIIAGGTFINYLGASLGTTTGDNKAHTHTYTSLAQTLPQSGNSTWCWWGSSTQTTGSSGGSINAAAGTYTTFWIKY
jgi:hypothetical protein